MEDPGYKLQFHFAVWAQARDDRANLIMILKTSEQLARLRPDWLIDLRFTELAREPEALLRTLGGEPPANLRLGRLFGAEGAAGTREIREALEGDGGAEAAGRRRLWEAEWRQRLAQGGHVIYTRNQRLATFFDPLRTAATPIFLELHQLKYPSEVKSLAKRAEPRLDVLKGLVRERREAERARLRHADGLFCISGPLAARVGRLKPGRPTTLLPCATTIAEEPPPAQDEARDLDLLYTGQLYHWKGLPTLIEALRHCDGRVRLTVVGGNDPAMLHIARTLARNFGVAERIDWIGQVPHRQVAEFQRRARIGAVPLPRHQRIARWYTSPIKIFEMMAAGTTLLVSDLPSLRDILMPGVTAEFCAPDDPRDWGRAIDRLLADPPLRQRLATAARGQVEQFSFSRRAERIIGVVEERA